VAKSTIPAELKYATTDEWVRVQGDEATIGITDFAQHELGDVVYLDLPWDSAAGRELKRDAHFGDIESVKATSPLFSPVSGTIVRVNEALKEHPEIINTDPYGEGWMIVVRLAEPSGVDDLLDADAYAANTESRSH
jgi:glycine cleavage system H protein